MRLVKFTDLGGNPVWVVDTWVQAIREARVGEFQQNAHTVIILSGDNIAVQEDLDVACGLLNGDGNCGF